MTPNVSQSKGAYLNEEPKESKKAGLFSRLFGGGGTKEKKDEKDIKTRLAMERKAAA